MAQCSASPISGKTWVQAEMGRTTVAGSLSTVVTTTSPVSPLKRVTSAPISCVSEMIALPSPVTSSWNEVSSVWNGV